MKTSNRREFLDGFCKATLCPSVGFARVNRLGCAESLLPLALERRRFGALDTLVDLI